MVGRSSLYVSSCLNFHRRSDVAHAIAGWSYPKWAARNRIEEAIVALVMRGDDVVQHEIHSPPLAQKNQIPSKQQESWGDRPLDKGQFH